MKQLITAEIVRNRHGAGEQCIVVTRGGFIVTPEAYSVAEDLGVEIRLEEHTGVTGHVSLSDDAVAARGKNTDIEKIRAEVLARLPDGVGTPELIDQLIRKMVSERSAAAKPAGMLKAPAYDFDKAGGIKRIKGNSLQMGIFAGAGEENQVGIIDVVTGEDGSAIAAGFMCWKKCFFPWTLTYDEINIVLEGELHIRHEGQTLVAEAGDVFFIPRNSSIEFGTPTRVRMFYVAYPANWSE